MFLHICKYNDFIYSRERTTKNCTNTFDLKDFFKSNVLFTQFIRYCTSNDNISS